MYLGGGGRVIQRTLHGLPYHAHLVKKRSLCEVEPQLFIVSKDGWPSDKKLEAIVSVWISAHRYHSKGAPLTRINPKR